MEHSCGNRLISRSDCVPFPTPGAPTRITRAARFSFLVAPKVILVFGLSVSGAEAGSPAGVDQVPIMSTSRQRREEGEDGGYPRVWGSDSEQPGGDQVLTLAPEQRGTDRNEGRETAEKEK